MLNHFSQVDSLQLHIHSAALQVLSIEILQAKITGEGFHPSPGILQPESNISCVSYLWQILLPLGHQEAPDITVKWLH